MASSPLSLWTTGGDPLEQRTSPTSSPSKSKPQPEPSIRPSSSSRLAPPALFQGPPSRNASNLSLHLPGANAAAIGLPASATASPSFLPSSTQQQQLDPLNRVPSRRPPGPTNPANDPNQPSPLSSNIPRPKPTGFMRHSTTDSRTKRENENDRADALWAEMQSTLAEVELSAAAAADANSSHVFGAGHARALEELRNAQLGLALAWGRSEREEVEKQGVVGEDGEGKEGGEQQQQQQQGRSKAMPGSGSAGNDSGSGGGGDGKGAGGRRKTLEEETENDILLARTRREANDRYFEQVNNAVVDVVRKLDEVAAAMRRVEKESRDIWSDEDDDGEEGEGGGDGSESVAGGSMTGG